MPNLLVIMMESAFPDASGQLLFFEVCAYAILVAVLTKFLRKRARPVAHPEDIAKLPALDDAINRMHGQEIGHLDLSHLPFRELPSAIAQAAPTATSISLCIAHPNAAIELCLGALCGHTVGPGTCTGGTLHRPRHQGVPETECDHHQVVASTSGRGRH
eukprot:m.482288 g.482288  ORF g.482288 m.482288 type:complete len:159 (-) comp21721_c1_seq29:892-1368(-)